MGYEALRGERLARDSAGSLERPARVPGAASGDLPFSGTIGGSDGRGVARIATVLSEVHEEYGGACLKLDGGDSIHGTAEALFTEGAAVPPLLNTLGIEVAVPGNWEYAYGWDPLQARIGESDYPWLAVNAKVEGESPFQESAVFEVDGCRVGVIGFSSDLVGKTMPRKLAPGVEFGPPADVLNEEADRLRSAGAQAVVVFSHLGLPQEWELSKEAEGVE